MRAAEARSQNRDMRHFSLPCFSEAGDYLVKCDSAFDAKPFEDDRRRTEPGDRSLDKIEAGEQPPAATTRVMRTGRARGLRAPRSLQTPALLYPRSCRTPLFLLRRAPFGRRTKYLVENRQHFLRRLARERIIDRLRLAARRDDPLFAQLGEMLRHRRHREADRYVQLSDGSLAVEQFAQDHEPRLIGHRLQKRLGLGRPRLQFL